MKKKIDQYYTQPQIAGYLARRLILMLEGCLESPSSSTYSKAWWRGRADECLMLLMFFTSQDDTFRELFSKNYDLGSAVDVAEMLVILRGLVSGYDFED